VLAVVDYIISHMIALWSGDIRFRVFQILDGFIFHTGIKARVNGDSWYDMKMVLKLSYIWSLEADGLIE